MLRTMVFSVALLAPIGAIASEYRASSGLQVTPEPGGIYAVSGVPTWGAGDYWCAIGEYALRVLRLDYEDRLYVAQDYERGQRVFRFSTEAPEAGALEHNPLFQSRSIRVAGANKRVNDAFADCDARLPGRP